MFKIFHNLREPKKVWQAVAWVGLLFLVAIIFAQKIELSAVDLGRHLENGRLVFQNKDVLFKNFYSYTEPDTRFINHHWLAGVIFYGVYLLGGFKLLSIFNILLALLAFGLFFKLARQKSNFSLAAILSIPAIFLLSERVEVRPEIFSYIFLGLTWLIIENNNISRKKRLFFLVPLFVLWANIHIYFFVGLVLTGCKLAAGFLANFLESIAWSSAHFKKAFFAVREKLLDFLILTGACLITPNHLWGLFYPFNIFKNYGYQIAENKSIFFLGGLMLNYNFIIFKLLLLLLLVGLIANLFFSRKRWFKLFFGILISSLALFASRNLALFGLISLVLISATIVKPMEFLQERIRLIYPAVVDLIQKYLLIIPILLIAGSSIFLILDYNGRHDFLRGSFGVGLCEGSEDSFKFFKDNNLSGPIFNNYDSGSALIFGLAGKEKVFVDNRPEAYSSTFFTETYLPMQNDIVQWKKYSKQYNFKTIYFSHIDSTPWGEKFLANILKDEEWALIYFDRYFVILQKKSEMSSEMIAKLSVDKWKFRDNFRTLVKNSDLKSKFNLASLAQSYGQADLAEEVYRQILIDEPQNNRVLFALAYLYSNASDKNSLLQAVSYFERALERERKMPGAYNQFALVYWNMGEYAKAEHYWQLARKINHSDATAKYYLDQVDILKKRGSLPRD